MKKEVRLKINERVEFKVDKDIYKSNIQDIISKNSIAINIPVSGTKSYLPHIGESVVFYVFFFFAYYKYKGTLSSRFLEGGLRLLIIDNIKDLGKIQRREDYRIPISLEISYAHISEEIALKGLSNNLIKGQVEKFNSTRCIDLSAGGIKIFTKEKMENNDYVLMKINLCSNECIFVISKVIRVEKDFEIKHYKVGCKFENLNNIDREKIARFIFKKQRELMKR